MKNLKLIWKMAVAFGSILIMIFAVSALSFLSINSLRDESVVMTDETFPVKIQIEAMRSELAAMERDLLLAMLHSDDSSLAQAVEAKESEIISLAKALEESYADVEIAAVLRAAQSLGGWEAVLGARTDSAALAEAERFDASVAELRAALDAAEVVVDEALAVERNFVNVTHRYTTGIILVLTVLAVLTVVVMALRLSVTIRRPIVEIEEAAKHMVQGELSYGISYESRDEMGSLAESMRSSMQYLLRYIREIDRVLEEMAAGNFTAKIEMDFVGEFRSIQDSIARMSQNISGTLVQISQSADEVTSRSTQIADGARMLADGTEQQTSAVHELSATTAEVSRYVKENAETARLAGEKATHTAEAVSGSSVQMEQLMVAMHDIEEKSGEIGKIIKTIEDIAFQTNILALNAAVEAARAGSAGKGFAVVADEVRSLAARSAAAAQSTTELISNTVSSVKEGVRMAEVSATELGSVVAETQENSGLILQIATASERQADSLEQINLSLAQISAVVQTNADTSQESARSTEALTAEAEELRQLMNGFRVN